MTKYALFSYSTENVGDDIQSIAARRFLPRVDYFINRDYLNQFESDTDEEIKLIMNGWFAHLPQNIPFVHEKLKPLITSFFVEDKVAFSQAEQRQFLQRHQPIGCRSVDTKTFLDSIGVEAYVSGCLTLTLEPEPMIPKQDFILAVDVPSAILEKVKETSNLPVIHMEASINNNFQNEEGRFRVAEYYLYLYQSARFVITSRLHVTLPCLALGTPVLNIDINVEQHRFGGLRELAHHMTVEEFLGNSWYDINNPLPNPQKHLAIRENLIKECQAFTGYDSPYGFLHGRSPWELFNDPDMIQNKVTGLRSNNHLFGSEL